MKVKTLLVISILAIRMPMLLNAQEYEVEITATNKTIWVSKLPLPPNMTVVDFLMTIPELVDSNADNYLERYDVKLDGKIVNDSKDAFLANTCLREVEKIVINTSPENTHINNGFSGSIDIITLPIQKGFSGDVATQISMDSGLMPTANLRYSDGQKFEARADVNFDIYRTTKRMFYETVGDGYTLFQADTTRYKYMGQLARLYAKWKISDKDVLKVWFWENYMSDKLIPLSSSTGIEDISQTLKSSKKLAFNAIIDYSRAMKNGVLAANADYHTYQTYPGTKDELNMELKSTTRFNILGRNLGLTAAMNFSTSSNRNSLDNIQYYSPMLNLDYKGKRVKAVLNGRYKFFSRNFHPEGGNFYSGWTRDWTAEAKVLWQIVDHHALRFMLVRNAGPAANNLVYPESIFDEGSKVWRSGNPDLLGPETSSANVAYITDWSKGLHRFILNINAEINRRSRVIENLILFDSSRQAPYVYPVNTSYGDVLGLSAMLNYSYGSFYMTVGGNVFHNMKYSLAKSDGARYFNLMFAPSVQLGRNWFLNANYMYNSKVVKEDSVKGDCSLLSMRISKSLADWTFFAAIQDIFDGISVDVEYRGTEEIYRIYDPFPRIIELGAIIRF